MRLPEGQHLRTIGFSAWFIRECVLMLATARIGPPQVYLKRSMTGTLRKSWPDLLMLTAICYH